MVPSGRMRFLVVVCGVWACVGSEASVADEPAVAFRSGDGQVEITIAGQPFATYVYRDATIPRPYFKDVRAPGGIQVTRRHPPKPGGDLVDHPTFHPGIWLAFGDVSGADDWRNQAPVRHDRFVQTPQTEGQTGTFTVSQSYLSADKSQVLCTETCRYVIAVMKSGYLLASQSTFQSDQHDFTFGDQEEMGLGIRMATPLAVLNGGQLTNSRGQINESQVWGKTADWCDYSGTVDGQFVGVTVMPDPRNFRPCWFHVRDYGLLTANPFGRHAMTGGEPSRVFVKQNDTFSLDFAVVVHGTKNKADYDAAAAYREYLSQPSRRQTSRPHRG
jgi:methane monooxygenase PmoA-like